MADSVAFWREHMHQADIGIMPNPVLEELIFDLDLTPLHVSIYFKDIEGDHSGYFSIEIHKLPALTQALIEDLCRILYDLIVVAFDIQVAYVVRVGGLDYAFHEVMTHPSEAGMRLSSEPEFTVQAQIQTVLYLIAVLASKSPEVFKRGLRTGQDWAAFGLKGANPNLGRQAKARAQEKEGV